MIYSNKKNNKGFTLVEILLYMAIAGIIVLAISSLLFLITQSKIKNQVITDVEYQGIQVMKIYGIALKEDMSLKNGIMKV